MTHDHPAPSQGTGHGTAKPRSRRAAALVAALLLAAVVTGCDSEGGGGDKDSAPPAEPRSSRWRYDYVSASRDTSLFDIAVVSKDEGWALGRETRGNGADAYVLLHRRGSAWRRAEMPLRPVKGAEFSNTKLEASGPGNVWLFTDQIEAGGIGAKGSPQAVRWDGDRWRRTSVDFSVLDVTVLGPDDVWALDSATGADGPAAHHWDGKRWTRHILPHAANALSASGPDDVWAAGYHDGQPAIMHFDGKKWRSAATPEYRSPKPKPDENASLTEIVAIDRDDAWAFGSHSYTVDEDTAETHDEAFALHWDGKRWRKAPKALDSSGEIQPYPAMSATQDGAGGFVLGSRQHHTSDGTLHVIKEPKPVAGRSQKVTAADRRQHFQLSDLQLVPGTHEVWAVGYAGVEGDDDFMRGVIAAYSTGG
ncbi:hypothetical protein B7755_028340 [Streptomyces sp. NBS 14/10]|uniref:hypothetical protein n=1 Tax=Streptomyces sp. NBS 14/10 TaxID=1945643 RepID=UPI00117FE926|nr:hypothetical protein [Streptomyces sp. NBS 14/10]KAK1181708.1 hypothetical protein B7755_028340 [Streptomyces sp. NBS 14/10]